MRLLLPIYILITSICRGQDLTIVSLTQTEIDKGVQQHYQFESKEGHVGYIDLFLFKDGSFEYTIASNIYNAYSIGKWKGSRIN
jgi:hypothetical protein